MSVRAWSSGILVSCALIGDAHAQSVDVREIGEHISEATVTVPASPRQVYDVVTDYANWPRVFTDVRSVEVEEGGRDDATVRFESRAFGMKVTVQFDNVPGESIKFRGIEGPPGGEAHGEYVLTPIGDGTRTQVTARMYVDIKGPASWVVRDKKVRAMRREKLRADMSDAAGYFERASAR